MQSSLTYKEIMSQIDAWKDVSQMILTGHVNIQALWQMRQDKHRPDRVFIVVI